MRKKWTKWQNDGRTEKNYLRKKSESLVTGDIVYKLTPHGIYGSKDDGHKPLKLEKNYTEAVTSWGLTSSVSADLNFFFYVISHD